ncbi:cell wall protein RBR3-like [Lytechinus variegatus]|uniref:cell wall protein RBR3-like n=1 Tax=Lytechinus variegatus TaxID=7654 RepID=UPI001BB11849|nr:cell wall protein RBR3-like [Lytechinus variegatus]
MTTSSPDQEDGSTSVPSMTSTATMTTSSPNQEDGSTSVPPTTSTATMTTSSPDQQDGSTSVPSMTSTATMTTSSPYQQDGSTSVPSTTSTATMTTSSPDQQDGSTSVPSLTSTETMSAVETQPLSTTSHLMTTSALMGDETTFASETTPPPLTFSSTTEVSISSTGQNNGESTTVSADTNAGCDDIICQNGGTFEEVSCTCRCTNGYQGDACQNLESEAQYGVEITLQASIDMWQSIRGLLLRVVAEIVTDWCNINFSVCCPNQGEKNSEEILDYVNETDIAIAVGYPEETTASGSSDQSFSVMLLVTPPLSTELCNSGSLSRRRRSVRLTLSNIQKRSSETEVSYLDQEALYSAVTENLDTIELELNMTIEEIVMGEVVSAPSELSAAVIVGIVVSSVVVCITIIIGVFIFIQKR